MKQTRITLNIVPQIHVAVDDAMEVIDTCGIVTAAKILSGNLVIKDKQTMVVKIKGVVF